MNTEVSSQCVTLVDSSTQGLPCPFRERYPEREGIRDAIGPLIGRNRIAAAFYDGPGWVRMRPWERLFLTFQGGQTRARRAILRHLPRHASARVLEVGIGDGENVPLLAPGWSSYGVDIARTQLIACLTRFPALAGCLAWAEGEALPFVDQVFDATFTIGGFNFFRDHVAAIREMRRVTRPGGLIVVADEIPGLYQLAPGHVLGFEGLDRWWLGRIGLDAEFLDMAFQCRIDLRALVRRELPGARYYPIWNRLGYCLVDRVR
jgi:SAM-dependent methyltransferase